MNPLNTIRERFFSFSLLDSIKGIEISRKKALTWSAYFFFGLIIFSLVFTAKYYVPQVDDMARNATSNLEGITVEFSYLEPQLFPPRVMLDYLRIYEKKPKKPILLLKDTDIRLSLFPLLVGKVSLSIDSRMYGGLMAADISTGMLFNTDWVSVDLKLDMVELEKIPQVKEYDRSFKGFASVETSFDGNIAFPSVMEGDLLVKVDQLDMENRFPIVKGARLSGYKVVLDCSLDDGLMTVRDFDLSDNDGISLKADGTIAIDQSDFNKSLLDLRGKFLGSPARLATSVLDPKVLTMLKKKQAVPVVVVGPLEGPQVLLK
ncbi:hypothetical protein SYK_28160 [Pseudodesulfovibrio nedwellii]|uniref:Type II secretion system protein GspN n=1 Tax=Pseudodesulfovibrio nedwellii TaxID=2973072 RepID=A0ABM8B492_9BACT|nr:type II secretion system protein GspN [Pseudodesulfovibrio nedwellii]BDQ38456.1 hypothetical protein SYK_28160 [Pseudodesulfovibrio nedwellii]